MTTTRGVSRAVGSTGVMTAAYRVDLSVGAHELVAVGPVEMLEQVVAVKAFPALAGAALQTLIGTNEVVTVLQVVTLVVVGVASKAQVTAGPAYGLLPDCAAGVQVAFPVAVTGVPV